MQMQKYFFEANAWNRGPPTLSCVECIGKQIYVTCEKSNYANTNELWKHCYVANMIKFTIAKNGESIQMSNLIVF